MPMKTIVQEKDACAIIALVDKRGQSTHANIVRTIDALRKMGHRSGDINGEGDGCGILTDIPRDVWARRLAGHGMSPYLAESRGFFIGHLLVPGSMQGQYEDVMEKIRGTFRQRGFDILMELKGMSRNEVLGPRAREEAPLFWQVAGMISGETRGSARQKLFRLQLDIEGMFHDVHIASLSLDSAVYKLRGIPEFLPRVYPELLDEESRSIITLGHSRYSTNTLPTVERAQPFSILGHNGEVNTIERLRSTGRILGIRPVPGGSDSQDLNRILEGLVNIYGLEPMEALEMVFPAVYTEVEHYQEELRDLYAFYRWFFPSSAQGPVAVVARVGDICMGSVDALGLRPLWFGESDDEYFLSSEKGVVDLKNTLSDPRPLAPGEKIAINAGFGRPAYVLDYGRIQAKLLSLMELRGGYRKTVRSLYSTLPDYALGQEGSEGGNTGSQDRLFRFRCHAITENILKAFGWQKYDLTIRKKVAMHGRPVIGSMGHQGPLAFFVPDALPNIAEYFKENVAVVTNPAIDREREAEHFTTRVILGDRPNISSEKIPSPVGLELKSPLLLDSFSLESTVDSEKCRKVAGDFGVFLLENVIDFFTAHHHDQGRVCVLDATFKPDEGLEAGLKCLCAGAGEAVAKGSVLLVLDDSLSFDDGRVFIDPALAVTRISTCLEKAGLRRECSIIVRSAAVRNLHDFMLLLGLGADAINPYLFFRVACDLEDEKHPADRILLNTLDVLQKGMEKVMSTMGIHELCGYGRIFSSIGLSRELEKIFRVPNFCGSDRAGLSFRVLEEMGRKRYAVAGSENEEKVYTEPRRNPVIGRVLRSAALGKKGYLEMAQALEKIDSENPIAIRHTLGFRSVSQKKRLAMDDVDISVGGHSMPVIIAAMSFGSQGESSFRAYAEAARKVNIICINGEGGEIPDMLGKYRRNRCQQIASGRFGVYMGLLNSSDFLEIKIGQGAKPGEGGHLPGSKVSEAVARARHCKPGITLISPSNQHDIYSIEDLAQIITELKTANPEARISVKVPVTSGVGTIAVGIAKAGADIVNLSGFEGGTGAAREHAKRYVGLPVEIGVSQAHRALVESGLRNQVEIWCDGGMRSGADVLKMILLGANRAGLGTVALMGVGCISCQRCHLDSCPRGISTQLRTRKDAAARGVKGFSPRHMEIEAENLARLLRAIGDEIRSRLASLGQRRLQDLVGRTDLLVQETMGDDIDAGDVLKPPEVTVESSQAPDAQVLRKPLNYLTRLISDLSMERFAGGRSVVDFAEDAVTSMDRSVGTYLAGAMTRKYGASSPGHTANIRLNFSVPGNGLCAFNVPAINTTVTGGSQDGAAKGSFGGYMAVLKGLNLKGSRVDGSTGKSFAYGAIGGTFIVQNMADSRACIRMSGADVVFGGRITFPVRDSEGNIATRAHLKGFAFEYMTGGRAVVLGDPGPWMCAGMTGGVIFQCLYPEFGFDRNAVRRRLSVGANVSIKAIDDTGVKEVERLLGFYVQELRNSFQAEEADAVSEITAHAKERFVMIVPRPMRPSSAG
ncbi:MAG TPA: glutamate synthase [Thermodesulfobacteriaceae bacterium]|nr:glutamate synthase [Thermodesulfobacteriaceae bacterium]